MFDTLRTCEKQHNGFVCLEIVVSRWILSMTLELHRRRRLEIHLFITNL